MLIVEDDEFLRSAFRTSLEALRHDVTEAEDGKAAVEIITRSEKFDIIFSDIQMPRMTGVELLKWVKLNHPTIFILMTGFSTIVETASAHQLGADDFIPKPYREAEIARKIDHWLNPRRIARAAAAPARDQDYCKVPLSEFVSTPVLMFDVYVKLGIRFVKVGHEGDETPLERIRSYRDKGLKFLYTTKADFRQLVRFNLGLAKSASRATASERDASIRFLRYTGETVLEHAFTQGVDQESFSEATEFLISSMAVIADHGPAFALLQALNEHADYLYAHSLAVSVYAGMLGRAIGVHTSQELFTLAVCGLYHDIGMKEIPRAVLNIPVQSLSPNDREVYESHVSRGHDIILNLKSMPPLAARVCQDHHERNDGKGFPRGLKRFEIHQYVQIIRVADVFAEYCLKRADGTAGMGAHSALSHMSFHHAEDLDPVLIQALRGLFAKSQAA